MVKKPRLSAFLSFISQLKPRKLFGNKRRRSRRTVLFAGGGCVLVAALLVLLFSKPGTTAMMPAQAEPTQSLIATGQKTVQIDGEYVSQGSPGAQPTINMLSISPTPMVTEEIPADAPYDSQDDVMDAPLPTTTPTPTPSATPSPTPVPTPTPVSVDMNELAEYFMVEADLYYNEVGYSSNYYEYTEDELYMLAQLIYGEARGESTTGKIAVANVVMNRVLARGYPGDTIEEVIKASGQFSGYSSSIRPNSSCKSAARQVLDYQVWVVPQNTYFFNSDRSEGDDWGGHDYYKRIGNHNFYTESYSGRSRIGDVPPALFERTFKWPQYGCKPEKRVKRLQYMLNSLGYDVKADGYFGMTSKEAIMEFQNDHGLQADGVAGPDTIKKIIKEFGVDKYVDKYM